MLEALQFILSVCVGERALDSDNAESLNNKLEEVAIAMHCNLKAAQHRTCRSLL